jgi:hypothetical protein
VAGQNLEVNDPATVAGLSEAFHRYERALAANDVATLIGLFRTAPETTRFGPAESLYGSEQIAEFRRARPKGDAARTLVRYTGTTYGEAYGVTTAEFVRNSTGQRGQQTQTWVREAGAASSWRVVLAHVALLAQPAS